MSLFIENSIEFIKKNAHNILLVVLGILIFVIFKVKYGINTNIVEEKKLKKEVIIETMANNYEKKIKKDSMFEKIVEKNSQDFCETLQGKSDEIEELCKKQTDGKCKARSCCVLVHSNENTQCLAGDKQGPIYHTDTNGKNINFDYYYYQNKCYGISCPKN